jgi:hypothetical protein
VLEAVSFQERNDIVGRLPLDLERAAATMPATGQAGSLRPGMPAAGRDRRPLSALAASAARASAGTPQMAEVVRKEEDLHKQAVAQAALLSNALAEPPEERDPNAVKDLQEEPARLRKDRQGARREIQRRFPEYASLIRPAPTTVDDIRASLRADEALLSFYFGSRESFVWAIPRMG